MLRMLIALLFVVHASAETVKTDCYTVSYYFLEVAELCISYSYSNNSIKTEVTAETKGILKLFKNIRYTGGAVADRNFNTKRFFLYRKEYGTVEIHRYLFYSQWVEIVKKIIKGAQEIVEKKKVKNKGYTDPLTGSLYYYRHISENKPVKKRIFFNGKGYLIPYKNRKEVSTENGKVVYVEIDPSEMDVGGLIQPTGTWKLWIEPRRKILLKAQLKIKAGVLKIKLKKI
ncbi:DUF3108 domain-containing protein [Persephonella sp.]